jgi:hypothetical protein
MKLTDLNPRWFAIAGRHGQGVVFDCPCCVGKEKRYRLAVAFAPALDGGATIDIKQLEPLWDAIKDCGTDFPSNIVPPGFIWARTGETFETLTVSPSVNAAPAGHFHGWVINGEVTSC